MTQTYPNRQQSLDPLTCSLSESMVLSQDHLITTFKICAGVINFEQKHRVLIGIIPSFCSYNHNSISSGSGSIIQIKTFCSCRGAHRQRMRGIESRQRRSEALCSGAGRRVFWMYSVQESVIMDRLVVWILMVNLVSWLYYLIQADSTALGVHSPRSLHTL